jgi:hypothetical protein
MRLSLPQELLLSIVNSIYLGSREDVCLLTLKMWAGLCLLNFSSSYAPSSLEYTHAFWSADYISALLTQAVTGTSDALTEQSSVTA